MGLVGQFFDVLQVGFDLIIQAVLRRSRFRWLGLLFIDDPLRKSVLWVRKLRLAYGGKVGCSVVVITDADLFPDGLAVKPVADVVDALWMMLRFATHETPVGT